MNSRIKLKSNRESRVWFSSDYHLNHANIIKYSNRPFKDVEDMNETIIKNHNSRVRPEDQFWFLGDFCFGMNKIEDSQNFLRRLNGHKNLIFGNHDNQTQEFGNLFESAAHYAEITVNQQMIVLCHYAFRIWNKAQHGSYNCYAHSHGTLPDDPNARAIDIGIDCHNYFPISFEDIQKIMNKKSWRPVDHHRSQTN